MTIKVPTCLSEDRIIVNWYGEGTEMIILTGNLPSKAGSLISALNDNPHINARYQAEHDRWLVLCPKTFSRDLSEAIAAGLEEAGFDVLRLAGYVKTEVQSFVLA